MSLLGIAGIALIYCGQYLYKEKFIKSGLREGLHNTSVSGYPENREAKKLMIAGQVCIGVDIIITVSYQIW